MQNELRLTVIERKPPAEVFFSDQIYRRQMGTQPDFRLLRGFARCLVIEAILGLVIVALIAIVKAI